MHLIKQNVLLKSVLRTLILMARAIPSRNTLKKYNIFAAIKFIKNIVTNLDSSKSSATDCISVMVLENCKS